MILERIVEAERKVLAARTSCDLRDRWGVNITAEHVTHYLSDSRERYRLLIDAVLGTVKAGAKVLDVGTAYGVVPLVLSGLGYEVVATDLAENLPAYARAIEKEIEVAAWDICLDDCPFRRSAFDAVIASEVLEHLLVGLPFAVRKLAEPLRDGGWLLITTPNLYRLPNMLKVIAGRNICEELPAAPVLKNGIVVDNRCHPREPVSRELLFAARDCGFRKIRLEHFNTARRSILKSAIYFLAPSCYRDHILLMSKKEAHEDL